MSPEIQHQAEHEPRHPSLIYLSHVDYVHPKLRWNIHQEKVSGVLDDMVPSALLMSLVNELKGEVHFTTDEEKNMSDARRIAKDIVKKYRHPKELFKYYADRSWLPQVVVCEVTDLSVSPDVHVTFENLIFTDAERIRKMMKPLKDINYTIWGRGSWDESYVLAEHKLPTFVLGLPITDPKGKLLGDAMHTYRAYTTRERIDAYRRTLQAIDMEFG